MPYKIEDPEDFLEAQCERTQNAHAVFIKTVPQDGTSSNLVEFESIETLWRDLAEIVALYSFVRGSVEEPVNVVIFPHFYRPQMIKMQWTVADDRGVGDVLICLPTEKAMADVCLELLKFEESTWATYVTEAWSKENGVDDEPHYFKTDIDVLSFRDDIADYYTHMLLFDGSGDVLYFHDEKDVAAALLERGIAPDADVKIEPRARPDMVMRLYQNDIIWCCSEDMNLARDWFESRREK